MSHDFKTYSALTHSQAEFRTPEPQHDLAELARLGQVSGYGEAIYDNDGDAELAATLSEFS